CVVGARRGFEARASQRAPQPARGGTGGCAREVLSERDCGGWGALGACAWRLETPVRGWWVRGGGSRVVVPTSTTTSARGHGGAGAGFCASPRRGWWGCGGGVRRGSSVVERGVVGVRCGCRGWRLAPPSVVGARRGFGAGALHEHLNQRNGGTGAGCARGPQ